MAFPSLVMFIEKNDPKKEVNKTIKTNDRYSGFLSHIYTPQTGLN